MDLPQPSLHRITINIAQPTLVIGHPAMRLMLKFVVFVRRGVFYFLCC